MESYISKKFGAREYKFCGNPYTVPGILHENGNYITNSTSAPLTGSCGQPHAPLKTGSQLIHMCMKCAILNGCNICQAGKKH